MPATRRSNAKAGGPANRGGQKTLSFGNRSKVTKPAISQQVKSLEKDAASVEDVSNVKSITPTEDEPVEPAVEVAIKAQLGSELERPKTEEESKALKLKDSAVKKYWKEIEAERKAPRVHQQDLTTNEKILRHFDLSSQYAVYRNRKNKKMASSEQVELEATHRGPDCIIEGGRVKPGKGRNGSDG